MAKKEFSFDSPVKVITSGTVPSTTELKKGELAYGSVGGINRLYGNPTGDAVIEISAMKIVTNEPIATGKKWIDGANIYQRSFSIGGCAAGAQVSLYTDGVGTGALLTVVPELTMLRFTNNSGCANVLNRNVSGEVCLYIPKANNADFSTVALRNNSNAAIAGVLTVYFTKG
jgi:hypothetical protein